VNDYILLHHDDTSAATAGWPEYFAKLRASGAFSGGSSIGAGQCFRKSGEVPPIAAQLVGYPRPGREPRGGARVFGGQFGLRGRRHRRDSRAAARLTLSAMLFRCVPRS
jgi:hypothetical protein